MRVTWTDKRRTDITFSLPGASAARAALQDALSAVEGATVSGPHEGYWRGERETSYTISLVGTTRMPAALIRELHAAGCEAVQVEMFGPEGYRVAEVRP